VIKLTPQHNIYVVEESNAEGSFKMARDVKIGDLLIQTTENGVHCSFILTCQQGSPSQYEYSAISQLQSHPK
jgi:hypothetical protein